MHEAGLMLQPAAECVDQTAEADEGHGRPAQLEHLLLRVVPQQIVNRRLVDRGVIRGE